MLNWEITEDIQSRQEYLETSDYKAYCLYTKTGWETSLATHLNLLNKDILALPFLKMTHTSCRGVKGLYQKVLLPSYVFLYCPPDYKTEVLDRRFEEGFNFVTLTENKDLTLSGNDLKYAKWVFSSAGIIGLSKAIRVGSKVKIIEGPLLSLEGEIKEYSKKNRNCRVETTLFNQVMSVWLPFVWVEEIKD